MAVVSPAGCVLAERVDGAVATLERMGLTPVPSPNCKGIHWRNGIVFSGSVENRLADLTQALVDPEIKAILCSRGGYGALEVVNLLDERLIKDNPKWVIGFSDITALHALMLKSGVVSLHAPMAKHLSERGELDSVTLMTRCLLEQGVTTEHAVGACEWNREGIVTAPMVGGNFTVMMSLLGTPLNMIKPGVILFVEDVGEEIYRVERMMWQLKLSGALVGLKGLVVGQFTEHRGANEDMMTMIRRMVDDYDFPVAFNFPVGHVDYNVPLVEGVETTLTVDASGSYVTSNLSV